MSWGPIVEMGHVVLYTSDLDGSTSDAVDLLGLRLTKRSDDRTFLSATSSHHELLYVASDNDRVAGLGLRARDGDALRLIRQTVESEGLAILSGGAGTDATEDSLTFVGPEGFVFEVYVGKTEYSAPIPVAAQRYGHINLHPADARGMMTFLQRVLGFRLSDVVGDGFAYFMRCNAEHHGIAIIKGRGTMHHHAWQAKSVADLVALGDRLSNLGRELIWGPVRHGAGHNIAAYYVERNGVVVELYTDLEVIYDDDRPPVEWKQADNWFNLWSSDRPLKFRDHGVRPVDPRRDGWALAR